MDKKHIKTFKEIKDKFKLVKNPESIHTDIYKKYWDSPLVKPLNLTDEEFKDHLGTIRIMVEQQESCDATPDVCSQTNGYHTKLIRDEDGTLQEVSVPCDKMSKIRQIRSNYVYQDFPKEWFARLLDTKSFGNAVDPTKAKLLQMFGSMKTQEKIQHGVYVYGNVGVGKTFTMVALANELALRGNSVAFIVIQDLSYKIKNGFNKENQGDNEELIEKLKNADVLFLDDVDTEVEGAWFYSNFLMVILNYRMNHQKPTFFTSNKNLNDYEKKINYITKSPEIAKRLMERIRTLVNNEEFNLRGPNLRYTSK
ncbi:MAG: ATP-binding protein [Mycoplasmataceae bacterium]|nr:ATP-binding protein [Mycoplasmataceae bacterium]